MRFILSTFVLLLTFQVFAIDRSDKVYDAIGRHDYGAADSLLSLWAGGGADSPEFIIAKFNRYLNESRQSVILLSDDVSPQGEAFMLSDSTDNIVGSISEAVEWNDSLFEMAREILSRGIEKYPDRIDMRFGYCAALQMRGRYRELVDMLDRTLEYGKQIDYVWLWADSKPLDGPVDVMLDSMWDYSRMVYETEDDALTYSICSEVLKYFPDELRFINMCGAIKYFEGAKEEALTYFMKALTLSPQDEIVMSNIARVSFEVGNYNETEKMCEAILAIDGADEEIKDFARDLKKKLQEVPGAG